MDKHSKLVADGIKRVEFKIKEHQQEINILMKEIEKILIKNKRLSASMKKEISWREKDINDKQKQVESLLEHYPELKELG